MISLGLFILDPMKQTIKVFYLSSCNTCIRIIKELELEDKAQLQDIKQKHISAKELDSLFKHTSSYEALFNKRAMKYRSQGWSNQELSDRDFRKLILQEYTFLKRPIIIINDIPFIGNAKKTLLAAKEALIK